MRLPDRIVAISDNRWVRVSILILWLLSGLWTLERGWVWESWERSSTGSVIHRKNYFDLDRLPLFVATTTLIAGYLITRLRDNSKAYFGLLELVSGVVGAYLVLRFEVLGRLTVWLAYLGVLTLVASGFDNMRQGIRGGKPEGMPPD